MTKHYILQDREPIEEPNLLTWARWYEMTDRTIKETTLSQEVRVLTVFLGFDYRFGRGGPPLLFETVVFGGEHNGKQRCYSAWDEAVAGHDAVVNELDK